MKLLRAFLLVLGIGGPRATPRSVDHLALMAVEGDSAPRVRARWEAQLRANPTDRETALGLATLARLTYDYPGAGRRYAALFDAPPSDRVATYALLDAATAAYANGYSSRSDSLHVRALARARSQGDSAAQAMALAGLAMDRGPTLGGATGLALADSAWRVAPTADTALRADIAVRQTILMAVLSDTRTSAEGALALRLARATGERRLQGLALRAMALDAHLRARDDSAVSLLVAAEELQRAARDHGALSETLLRHSDIQHSRGDVGLFKSLLEQVLQEAQASSNLYALASAHVGLAVVGLATGDYEMARTHLDESARRYAAQGDESSLYTSKTFQADLLLATGNLADARAITLQVRDFRRRTGDASEEFEALRTLAAIDRRAGRYDVALGWLDTASALARRRGRSWGNNLTRDRGTIELARGHLERAAMLLSTYVTSLDTTDHVPRYAARELLATAAARAGDLPGAERELESADDELDAWRASLTSVEMRRLAFQVRGSDIDVEASAMPLVIATLASHDRGAAAFAFAERRRARTLADQLVRARALAARGPAPSAAPRGATRTSGLAAAGRLVNAHTALLEFVTGAEGAPTTLFVVTAEGGGRIGTRSFPLPSADSLAPRILRFVGLLEAGSPTGRVGDELGALMRAPLAALGPTVTQLVVVPDGPLHHLPFDALPMTDGRVIAQRFAVSLAPSAVVAAELAGRETSSPRRAARLLALGDPAPAEVGGGGAPLADVPRAGAALGPLPGSADEVRMLARLVPRAVVRTGRDASAAYLKHAALDSFDVIHLATHALVDERSVERTALVLSPGGGESGLVTPGDLAALHLDASLVFLSACQSAGGLVVDGEGVQGLTAPLLEAGARSVVATYWRIGDRATTAFVADFYRHLAARLTVTDALRAAKLDAIRRGAPPSEWAAFTVVGDPAVSVALPVEAGNGHAPEVAAVVILIAIVALAMHRRTAASRRGDGTGDLRA